MNGRTEEKHTGKRLDDAMRRGELPDLPPNAPKGILGERGFDIYKVDDFEPDLNAGISQENDLPVIWLAIVLAFLLFFPVGFWLLWRTPLIGTRSKIIVSAVGALGVFAVGIVLLVR